MSSPRLPKSEEYWKRKGISPLTNSKGNTTYKNVMLYTHDDLDGIYSALLIKNILKNRGYNIIGYGIVNYQEGWKYTTLRDNVINIAVDFASYHTSLHVYVDHHIGKLPEDKKDYAIKTSTGSAFEGISYQYNIPIDSLTLHPIDMVDSAKYDFYGVDITSVINFNWGNIFKSNKKKLTFTGMINQFIKRADHTTLIEVIHNCTEPSIYNIFLKLKEFYSGNNLQKEGIRKDFIIDGQWRINTMKTRTRGTNDTNTKRKVYRTQDDFIQDFWKDGKISIKNKGYQILGKLAFIPSGTWANSIRARAILEEDIRKGKLDENSIDFILLQYGNTLQMVAYNNINDIPNEELPKYKNGDSITNIGLYMEKLLANFKEYLGYNDPSTYISTLEDDITVAGGHGGIGSISNICGICKYGSYNDMKYIDLIKNKIIQDISNSNWNTIKLKWTEERYEHEEMKTPDMDYKVIMIKDIRKKGTEKSFKEIIRTYKP